MLARRSGRGGGVAVAVGLVAVLFALDWVTRAPIAFGPLFVAPVALAAIVAGARPAVAVAALALCADAALDHLLDRVAADPIVRVWDLASLALAYGVVIALVTTRAALAEQERLNRELAAAMQEIRTLRGLLPMCAWCGQIRDEHGDWETLQKYVASHTEASFTHGICPDCAERFKQDDRAPG